MFSDNSASFISGAFAGLVTDLSLHPLDTIKTKLQAAIHHKHIVAPSVPPHSTSKFQIRNLFRGLTPALCGSCPSGAAFFGTYQFCSRKLEIEKSNSSANLMCGKSLVASCLAESSACIVRAPVEIVKNNMQIGRSLPDSLSHLSGKKFVSVYVALLYRELPFAMVQLPALELLRQNPLVRCIALHLSSEYSNVISDKRVGATVVAAFFAGGFAGWITTPFDVYKTSISTAAAHHEKLPPSFFQFISTYGRDHGIRGLFRGGASRMTMISCGGSIFFGSQEWMKKKLLAM